LREKFGTDSALEKKKGGETCSASKSRKTLCGGGGEKKKESCFRCLSKKEDKPFSKNRVIRGGRRRGRRGDEPSRAEEGRKARSGPKKKKGNPLPPAPLEKEGLSIRPCEEEEGTHVDAGGGKKKEKGYDEKED